MSRRCRSSGTDLRVLATPSPRKSGSCRSRDAGRLTSIGRRSFTPGNCADVIRRFLRTSWSAQQARNFSPTRRNCCTSIIDEKLLTARGVYGFWPANSLGDDVEIYRDEARAEVLATFHFLRQQMQKPAGQVELLPGGFCRAERIRASRLSRRFCRHGGNRRGRAGGEYSDDHDDYNAILTKALADRLAEAFAEYLHRKRASPGASAARKTCRTTNLLRERYRGIRPAAGYPASPDHAEKDTLFDLLEPEENAGIPLTESFAMHPGASVSGLYFSHPESRYFAVGKIERRSSPRIRRAEKLDRRSIEKWLAPNLAY